MRLRSKGLVCVDGTKEERTVNQESDKALAVRIPRLVTIPGSSGQQLRNAALGSS